MGSFHHHGSSQLPSTDDRDGKTIIMLYVLFNVLYMYMDGTVHGLAWDFLLR